MGCRTPEDNIAWPAEGPGLIVGFRPKAVLPPACLDIRASDQDRDVSGGTGLSSNTCSPGPTASANVAATNAVFAFI